MNFVLESKDPLTQQIRNKGITSWKELTHYISALPYGRNQNRSDFSLVISEEQGTCSSKHAFLKTVADLHRCTAVSLVLGIYKMNAQNTPQVAPVLKQFGISYLPEAHCYLSINGTRQDLTTPDTDSSKLEQDLIEEKTIQPHQVIQYKVEYHQAFLKNWIKDTHTAFTFQEVWNIREKCIEALARS